MPTPFISREPVLEDYWRGIILFGRNVASYKFALAKTLLELRPESGQLLKMEELAPVFAKHISEHLKSADKQCTSRSSKFLNGCRDFNAGRIGAQRLHDLTVRQGFNNVIDAFHVVGQGEIEKRFYVDERTTAGGIRITDEFSEMVAGAQVANLPHEVEARWRLVETAWELGVNQNLLAVQHDQENETLYALDREMRRTDVTGSREALNGYQKGKCFYCFADFSLDEGAESMPDVDHFFPHRLKASGFGSQLDGVWNLVLSCRECNRGTGGKFDAIPDLPLVERLKRRNDFLISSHHPLRETLIRQTGANEKARSKFLNDTYERAWATRLVKWMPVERFKPVF